VAAKFLKLALYLVTVEPKFADELDEPKFADELDLIGSWKTYVRLQIVFSKAPSIRSFKKRPFSATTGIVRVSIISTGTARAFTHRSRGYQ
jgi:hypothetical protein